MRVVLRISHLEFILLFHFVPDYPPEWLEIWTHSEYKVEEIAGVLFGVFFLLLFELLQPYPTHACVDPVIVGLSYEG